MQKKTNMGVYAHRFIEILGKDNKWHTLPLWSKFNEGNYSQPDLIAGDLKLTKHSCFLSRTSSGFYSTGSLYSDEDISHSMAPGELSEEARQYVEGWEYPVRWEGFSLVELEAYADKCREKIYSELAEAFHDNNMRLIVGMLASAQEKEKPEDSEEYYHTPRYIFNEYLESYQIVVDELNTILFLVDEFSDTFDFSKVRVVYFCA